jgi:predicted signal transduction protein with EAL and GGDEF domain
MILLLCRQKVADFNAWKRVFDSHAEAQRQAGLRVDRILRNFDDANELFVLFEVTDVDKARGFVSSPQVPEAQKQSGVVGKTDVWFLA